MKGWQHSRSTKSDGERACQAGMYAGTVVHVAATLHHLLPNKIFKVTQEQPQASTLDFVFQDDNIYQHRTFEHNH